MANPQKKKGDRAELEVQAWLRENLGVPARRKLGAGRKDDTGDIDGVPDTVIQVCDWANVARAVREKPLEAEEQRKRAHMNIYALEQRIAPVHAATFVRLRGGEYRVVLTPEQWAALWREGVGGLERLHGLAMGIDAREAQMSEMEDG